MNVMHATNIIIFQSNLKKRVIDSVVEDEYYIQLKYGL
jgi:hypothetical protein